MGIKLLGLFPLNAGVDGGRLLLVLVDFAPIELVSVQTARAALQLESGVVPDVRGVAEESHVFAFPIFPAGARAEMSGVAGPSLHVVFRHGHGSDNDDYDDRAK